LEAGEPYSFEAWAAAVRAGRTYSTSGPLLDLEVDGVIPGGTISSTHREITLHVRAQAASVGRIDRLQLIINGSVAAESKATDRADFAVIDEHIRLDESAWIAARCSSPDVIYSAFPTSVGAHTSPVYVQLANRPIARASDLEAVARAIAAGADWAARRAVVAAKSERERFIAFFEDAALQVQSRMEASVRSGSTSAHDDAREPER
jgi:hypothetical protein